MIEIRVPLQIHEDVQRLKIEDPRFAPIYEAIVAYQGFVLAHVGPLPWDNSPQQAPMQLC